MSYTLRTYQLMCVMCSERIDSDDRRSVAVRQ